MQYGIGLLLCLLSGQCSGVQMHFQSIALQAIYVYCYTNTLNLVLVDAVKAVKSASDFFDMLVAPFSLFSC